MLSGFARGAGCQTCFRQAAFANLVSAAGRFGNLPHKRNVTMVWPRVRGHDRIIEGFAHVVKTGRFAHAYLFAGLPGIGKRLFARELAKTLLCEERRPDRFAACGQCVSCTLVDAGTHPDFFSVARPEEKNELPIDTMLELCTSFALKSARGKGKIAVLDDADDLNDESANCFLKTLEEPPPGSMFILVGTTAERQLATVVSRCQIIRFAPLAAEVVVEILRQDGVADPAHLARLARLSGGSPGQALALADPDLWKFRATLLEGLAHPQPATVALGRAWMDFAEEAGKETAAQRRRAGLVLRLLIDFLNDALAVALGKTPRLTDDLPLLQSFNDRVDPDRLMTALDRCLEAEFHLDRYVQLVLVLEGLVDALGQELVGAT
jgi:DNA polymerase-3 subunit delta'